MKAKDLDVEPYPDLAVRTRFRRGKVCYFLSPTNHKGEEWVRSLVPQADDGEHVAVEVQKDEILGWAERARAAGLVVLVGDGA